MRVAIIGGGAAGMMCAATLGELQSEAEVFLIEKNDALGKKVMITGGGRCNITTGLADIKTVLSKYPRGAKFLTSAIHRFSPAMVYEWFENHGLPLKCENDSRVFPQSNKGKDVVQLFESIFARHGVKVLLDYSVEAIEHRPLEFVIHFKDQPALAVDAVVIAVGGRAYGKTGSVGDGYALAKSLGHSITPLAPSLNSFVTKETWPKSVAGLSFVKAALTVENNKKYAHTGPILFTHQGLTGPAVFALSSLVAFENYNEKQPLKLSVDLFPDVSLEDLEKDLFKSIREIPKKSFQYALCQYIPLKLVEIVCAEIKISPLKKNGDINKKELADAVKLLKHLPLHIIGRGAGEEFVTAGGVELSEVNQRTMESKICPGLYLAGEILNIDGFTGGFNLQAAWATGYLAAESIAGSL